MCTKEDAPLPRLYFWENIEGGGTHSDLVENSEKPRGKCALLRRSKC